MCSSPWTNKESADSASAGGGGAVVVVGGHLQRASHEYIKHSLEV